MLGTQKRGAPIAGTPLLVSSPDPNGLKERRTPDALINRLGQVVAH
jgi:hypothetical protein